MSLHGEIMNLPAKPSISANASVDHAYRVGHRDARHAAAELALKADAEIERLRSALRNLDSRLRECAALGLAAAEAYDSQYQAETSEALAGEQA